MKKVVKTQKFSITLFTTMYRKSNVRDKDIMHLSYNKAPKWHFRSNQKNIKSKRFYKSIYRLTRKSKVS